MYVFGASPCGGAPGASRLSQTLRSYTCHLTRVLQPGKASVQDLKRQKRRKRRAGDVDATRRARNVVEGGRVVADEATRPRRMKRRRRARIVMSTGESTDAEPDEAPRVISRSVRRARIVMSTEAK